MAAGTNGTMRRMSACTAIVLTLALLASSPPLAQQRARREPLAPADIDALVLLVKLEDTRSFDETALTRLAHAAHPEVRRRAIVAVGRIADPRGRALLAGLHGETDPDILATVAFSTGQLKEADAIAWLSSLLSSAKTPPPAAFEAARALGKIRTPEAAATQARAALATYLSAAPVGSRSAP